MLCWLAAADAIGATSLEELAATKAQWESQRIKNYSFVISNACPCPVPQTGPLYIVVANGKLKRAVYLGEPRDGFSRGQSIRRRSPIRVTMDGLFEMIEKRLKITPATKIKYDDKLGYPVLFEYADSSLGGGHAKIELKDFKRL
jgi:hypothetical protein